MGTMKNYRLEKMMIYPSNYLEFSTPTSPFLLERSELNCKAEQWKKKEKKTKKMRTYCLNGTSKIDTKTLIYLIKFSFGKKNDKKKKENFSRNIFFCLTRKLCKGFFKELIICFCPRGLFFFPVYFFFVLNSLFLNLKRKKNNNNARKMME
jgi:hypothetical protein